MKAIILILIAITYSFATEITLGVVPQQSPLKLSKKWTKITEYLHKETGIKVIFKTEKSIPKFEKRLEAGYYDIAYMNPYHLVNFRKQKYEAFVRASKNIQGIVLSKDKNLEITKDNLKGKTFLFPAPNAFAATILPKLEFKEEFGFDIDKDANVLYVNSHDSVYKGISRNIGDIGGGIYRTYNDFNKTGNNNIFVVYKTKKYPSHPIAFHPRVDKQTVQKLQDAFLKMPTELKKILKIKKFILTNTEEFNIIKNIGAK
ncbi:phosphate/phosphite/phosphonate ABC transporter substrate-binding protein [Arcobacter peruensis]|uniref:phosphate/phosphite/phosphonate ABC transporter substrate-binding protein n=1 Tax=Arcobacter peruensis TaxID=2320140 RepID=UPI000F0766C4|nr:phosphate/phosphite/phosphonate ABC transporter substrate-binding protein [Arcobacter peruensis]